MSFVYEAMFQRVFGEGGKKHIVNFIVSYNITCNIWIRSLVKNYMDVRHVSQTI